MWTVGIVLNGDGLGLTLGVVGDGQLDGLQNCHDTLGGLVQILTQAEIQECQRNGVGALGDTDTLAEIADGGGGVATAAQTAQGGHTGIIPAGNHIGLHQVSQLALAEYGVVDAQAGELDLTGLVRYGNIFNYPVVQGAVILKL